MKLLFSTFFRSTRSGIHLNSILPHSLEIRVKVRGKADMASTIPEEVLSNPYSAAFSPSAYPNRTFRTQILPTQPNAVISFSKSTSASRFNKSAHGDSSEPFRSLSVEITDEITKSSLLEAASCLRQNNLVAFPTETVYGLGGSALSTHATTSIFKAKKRPMDNPLIVHVSDLDMLDSILPGKDEFDYRKHRVLNLLIQSFWPGPMTLLFPVAKVGEGEVEATGIKNNPDGTNVKEQRVIKHSVPSTVTCGLPTVAIRMPRNPLARALISLCGVPVAAPSANASGRPSPTESRHVLKDLGGELDPELQPQTSREECQQRGERGRIQYILEGGSCNVGVESTVIDCITNPREVRVLRPGGLSVEQIQTVLNENDLLRKDEDSDEGSKITIKIFGKDKDSKLETDQMKNPTTPGMKYRHYAPDSKVIMLINQGTEDLEQSQHLQARSGEIISSLPTILRDEIFSFFLDETGRQRNSMSTNTNGEQRSTGSREHQGKNTVKIGMMCRGDSRLLAYFRSRAQRPHQNGDEAPPTVQPSSLNDLQVHDNQNYLLEPIIFNLSKISSQDQSSHAALEEVRDFRIEMHPFSLGRLLNPEQSAQRIFSGLRSLDEGPLVPHRCKADIPKKDESGGCDLILVEGQTDEGMGLAVMNRLRKAASQVFNIRI